MLIVLSAVFTWAAGPVAAEVNPSALKRAVPRVRSVKLLGREDAWIVHIASLGTIRPEVTSLEQPARLVIDLPGTVVGKSLHDVYPRHSQVRAIRSGRHQEPGQALAARVVIDLDEMREYKLTVGTSGLNVLLGKPAALVPPVVAYSPNPQLLRLAAYQPAVAVRTEAAQVVMSTATTASRASSNTMAYNASFAPSATSPSSSAATPAPVTTEATSAAVPSHFTGAPISLNLREADLRDFFRMIHEVSGLNVVLEPSVKGTLTIMLDAVPWDQALDIVLRNNDLGAQREGNVLRVATSEGIKKEAESRKATQEAEAQAIGKINSTRYLSYAKAKEVAALAKKFVSSRGDVIADDRTNAIIVTDIPSTMPAIDVLIKQLDRKTQEVEIEARVVAATRSFARDIGTQLGFGFGNATTAVGGAQSVGTSPTQVGGITPQYITTGTNQIPLFSNLGVTSPTSGLSFLNATNSYRIDAILTMAESAGLLKILSRPRVVTQDNIQAVVKQGVRVPIVTQAQLNGPPTVNYVDAFLRLTVTPQITSEGTIFLSVDVENTTPDFGHTVQGNPSLITQQATTQILVTDGGTVVIGGVIQTTNSVNTSQVPLLGDIPVLGNLFKRRSVSTSNQELIFFITPKIIQT